MSENPHLSDASGHSHPPAASRKSRIIPMAIAGTVVAILVAGGLMFVLAGLRTNKVALADQPKGVTVIDAVAATYRPTVRYIGAIEPWVEARLGPQFTSAYVDTVLVRPGEFVKRGQVVATLDCRSASAQANSVAMQARALEAQKEAIGHEAARVGGLVGGGFVSPDEAEQKTAESTSKQAELLGAQARLLTASLEVNDCILRSPFDGEIADRLMDPGSFARPGGIVVTVVDRSTVRVIADVPEGDFAAVAPGTSASIRLLATGAHLTGKVSRRSPAADPSTRTIHLEIDLADPERKIPVRSTAELIIEVGEPVPATEVPLAAASVRNARASLFVVEGNVAHKMQVDVLGEAAGNLFVDPTLKPGVQVVTEGRALLKDGDQVVASKEAAAP